MGAGAAPQAGPGKVRAWAAGVVVFLLWLITSALGLVEVGLSREIAYGIYLRFAGDAAVGIMIGQFTLVLMALLWLAYVFGSGEYHWRHAGQPGSWTILIWAVAIELLILILYFVVAI